MQTHNTGDALGVVLDTPDFLVFVRTIGIKTQTHTVQLLEQVTVTRDRK
jgi:hypothetical protein